MKYDIELTVEEIQNEVWANIYEFEGYYQVSNYGRVRRIDSLSFRRSGTFKMKGRMMKPSLKKTGYLTVVLSVHGERGHKLIHRLVYEAFVGPIVDEINHIDKDRTNNHLSNLEDVTRQRNIEHSKAKHFKVTSPDGEVVYAFNMRKFCREHGLNHSNLRKVLAGKSSHCKGWTNGV